MVMAKAAKLVTSIDKLDTAVQGVSQPTEVTGLRSHLSGCLITSEGVEQFVRNFISDQLFIQNAHCVVLSLAATD